MTQFQHRFTKPPLNIWLGWIIISYRENIDAVTYTCSYKTKSMLVKGVIISTIFHHIKNFCNWFTNKNPGVNVSQVVLSEILSTNFSLLECRVFRWNISISLHCNIYPQYKNISCNSNYSFIWLYSTEQFSWGCHLNHRHMATQL